MSPEPNASHGRLARAGGLVLIVLLATVMAGCGGSGDEDVSRDDFIAEADAVCAQYAADSTSLERDFNQALSSGDLETAAQDFEDQASEMTAMLDQLAELTPPIADQTTMDQLIALGRQRIEIAQEGADAIASGDKDAMIAAGKRGSVLAGEYFQRTDSFGFDACGSGGANAGGSGGTGATGSTGS